MPKGFYKVCQNTSTTVVQLKLSKDRNSNGDATEKAQKNKDPNQKCERSHQSKVMRNLLSLKPEIKVKFNMLCFLTVGDGTKKQALSM